MNIEYSNNKLEKQLSDASQIKRAFGLLARKVQQRKGEIIDAPNLAVLMKIPAANCHPLHGDRKGEWAVDISPNHRMIFEIAHDPIPVKEDGAVNTILVTDIRIIGTGDYH